MVDELEFRSLADIALDALMQHLIVRETEDEAGFEVEGQGGLLIWISALSTSFKLDWDEAARAFALPKTGEQLIPLVDRLIAEQLAG